MPHLKCYSCDARFYTAATNTTLDCDACGGPLFDDLDTRPLAELAEFGQALADRDAERAATQEART